MDTKESQELELGKHLREFRGPFRRVTTLITFLIPFSLFYWTLFGVSDVMVQRAFYLMLTMVLCFIFFPFGKRSPKKMPSIVDWVLVISAVAGSLYIMIFYRDLILRLSALNRWDVFFGIIMIMLGLEVGRRSLGNSLPMLALLFIVYAFFGSTFPGMFKHRGFGIDIIVTQIYCAMEGYYGMATAFMVKYVVMFIVFGAFLEKSGAGKFFIDLAFALTRRTIGGPAKAAVMGSCLMGSISGSGVANVMMVGTFTIPMMKKVGYKPHVAAAIEAAGSNGGQIMPPVMGSVAFIMAEFTGIPYAKIALASAIPAIMYYITVYSYVHLQAKKTGITVAVSEDIPKITRTLKEGWIFISPLVVLILFIGLGYTPNMAGFAGIVTVVLASQLKKKNRMSFKNIFDAMVLGGRYTLTIGCIVPSIGIMLAIVGLTGLGLKLSFILTMISGGQIFFSIFLVGLISLILGTGLPAGPTYVITAIMCAPAMLQLGIPIFVAHMILIWYSIDSDVSPPIAVCAIAAAGIAHADPMKTMFTAWKYSKGLYILPFLFYYRPLLLNGPVMDVLVTIASSTLGLVVAACFLERYLFRKTKTVEQVLLGLSALLLLWPPLLYNIAGLLALAIVVFLQKRTMPGIALSPREAV
jgi:TRAP transporter 4TM/12TM fusion protein